MLQTFRGKEPFSRRGVAKRNGRFSWAASKLWIRGSPVSSPFLFLQFVCFVFDVLSGDTRILNLRVAFVQSQEFSLVRNRARHGTIALRHRSKGVVEFEDYYKDFSHSKLQFHDPTQKRENHHEVFGAVSHLLRSF